MTNTTGTSRVSPGVPTGGQFAAQAPPDSGISVPAEVLMLTAGDAPVAAHMVGMSATRPDRVTAPTPGTAKESLKFLPARAADVIDRFGWIRKPGNDDEQRVDLVDALRFCDQHPGDWPIACEVLRHKRCAEKWSTKRKRTQDEVTAMLRSTEITDTDLELTFGPSWRTVVSLVHRAATLTPGQCTALSSAGVELRGPANKSVLYAHWHGLAARAAAREATWSAIANDGPAAFGYAPSAVYLAKLEAAKSAWPAVRNTVDAVESRHLIGQYKFTQEHYDTLTRPWRSVVGPLNPGDTQLGKR